MAAYLTALVAFAAQLTASFRRDHTGAAPLTADIRVSPAASKRRGSFLAALLSALAAWPC